MPNDEPKNITMSDFEESFREENIPKKIWFIKFINEINFN
jgi:hypothetical protein